MNRRQFVKGAAAAGAIAAAGVGIARAVDHDATGAFGKTGTLSHEHGHALDRSVERQWSGAMTPMQFLEHFEYGKLPDGSPAPQGVSPSPVTRVYEIYALRQEIEIAKGVVFPAWTYNGMVPGPTIRATEGDTVRIVFKNRDVHPHTIHFHGIHAANMDGVAEPVRAGEDFVYEFTAEPFGCHLYHCHTLPLPKHVGKGLYGAYIVDPRPPLVREPAREMVMVMNGFDTDLDGSNDFYTVNGIVNYHLDHPIPIKAGELQRIYLVNVLEADLINSMHVHANFFKFWRTGTRLGPDAPYEYTDTVMMCQGERGILEFTYQHKGKFMFHAHQNEFAELGWAGMFDVV